MTPEVDIRGEDDITDAKTWKRACRHIALLLWWAAERGLAADEHDANNARKAPTRYFIDRCDTKLFNRDLSDEGAAFIAATYEVYLAEIAAYAKKQKLGRYDIPENATTAKHFFAWLDDELTTWRTKPKPKRRRTPR